MSCLYKINITISNALEMFADSMLTIQIELPYIPRKGDILYLSHEEEAQFEKLYKKAVLSGDHFMKSTFEHLVCGNGEFHVCDCIYVTNVGCFSEDKSIWVELDSMNDRDDLPEDDEQKW